MQLHSFARYISSSILSSFGFMVVWKCFLSLSFFKFYGFFFNFYFSIVNNLCRGSELSRDPWSSVCDVRLFYSCCDYWLVVAFPSGEARGFYFPALYGWCLSVLKISTWVFYSNFGRYLDSLYMYIYRIMVWHS